MGYGTVIPRKTELPELWSVLDEHGILATEVGEIAGCSQRRGKECMAGRKTFTFDEAFALMERLEFTKMEWCIPRRLRGLDNDDY